MVDKNGLYGYCNTSGEVVIEPQFAYAFEFEDGYAAVELTDGHLRCHRAKRGTS